MKLEAPITAIDKSPLKLKESSLSLTVTGEGCIDETTPQWKSTRVSRELVSGTAGEQPVTIDTRYTETRTVEPLKK